MSIPNFNPRKKVFIIAEVGNNHEGNFDRAIKLIDAAVDSGASAVKFQTYNSDELVIPTAKKSEYQLKHDKNDTQLIMLKKYELSKDAHRNLLNYSNQIGIDFISTPFDIKSLEFLIMDLKLKTIKISSIPRN